jgi:hypothetical protein
MRRAIIYLCVFAFSQTVLASGARTVLRPGDNSCGSWVEARQENRMLIQYWYIGFISGINMVSEKNHLAKIDAASAYLWMDKYCRENPLKNIVEGSGDLFIELKTN